MKLHTDFGALTELRHSVRSGAPEATEEVARQFEALMIQMMLKNMRDAMPEDALLGSDQMRMYQDMFDQQISTELSRGNGIGLRDALMRQLDPGYLQRQAMSAEAGTDSVGAGLGAYRATSIAAPMAVRVPGRGGEVGTSMLAPGIHEPGVSESGVRESGVHESRVVPGLADAPPAPLSRDASAQVPGPAEISAATDFWRPDSPETFVRELWPHARRAAQALGVAPEVLVAQAALETGWGRRMIPGPDGGNSFNLFGIKADRSWQGGRAQVSTLEYREGVAERQRASFRVYTGLAQSFDDYVRFLQGNPRYRQALEQAQHTESFVRGLQEAGYATDPKYADKILDILERGTLPGIVGVKNDFAGSLT